MKLSPEQLAAIECDEPKIAVIAGPGSGKTTVLVERAARLAREGKQTLVLAFTNAAVAIIAERIAELLKGVPIPKWPRITTFHAFCYNLICEEREYCGFTNGPPVIIDDAESKELFKQLRNEIKGKCPLDVIYDINATKPIEYKDGVKVAEGQHIVNEYRNRLHERGLVDFAGVVRWAINVIHSRATLHGFDEILIDEAQDVDSWLWTIISKLCECSIFAVGDPRQALFQWRGGDAEAFLTFAKTAKCFEMNDNYRATQALASEFNELFGSSMIGLRNEPKQYVTQRRIVAHAIRFDVIGDCISSGVEIAALASYNKTLNDLEAELGKRGITNYKRRRPIVSSSPGPRAVIAFCRWSANPFDEGAARTLLALWSMPDFIDEYIRTCKETRKAFNSEFKEYNIKQQVSDAFSSLLQRDTEAAKAWNSYIVSSTPRNIDRIGFIVEAMNNNIIEPESDEMSLLTLSTIHLAKGCEWDNVIILDEPDRRSNTEMDALRFVALTRARFRVFLEGRTH